MINLYSTLQEDGQFRKIEVNELLFVEYTCLKDDPKISIWSNNNYFAFITSGEKMWRSIHNSYHVNEGDIIFVKKGANLTHRFFKHDFCAIFIFIPDDFITAFLKRNPALYNSPQKNIPAPDSVIRIAPDELLTNYYYSIRSYLTLSQQPNKQLLVLKFEELLLSIFSNEKHAALSHYFISLCQKGEHQMSKIMEENYAYNLKLEDYARLCHMSLSTFKKYFKLYYKTSPAAWLKAQKLALAHQLIVTTQLPVNEIAFDCGFEDVSHFIRVFKQQYAVTPHQYRQGLQKGAH